MTDRIVVTPPTKEGAREVLNLFRPRISPAQARLNIKFAEAFDLPINPEWPEIAKEDQLPPELKRTGTGGWL
jgi:hypothetical protein